MAARRGRPRVPLPHPARPASRRAARRPPERPPRLSIHFVVTEHPSFLNEKRRARYEGVRATLERVGGRPVEVVHYLDAGGLEEAEAVVLSGSASPWETHDPAELERFQGAIASSERPVLGICAGMQLLAVAAGGEVGPMADAGREPERGYLPLEVVDDSDLLAGLDAGTTVFQDHEWEVAVVPAGFRVLARTDGCPVQAFAAPERRWWGTQFHPELWDDEHPDGERILRNFFRLSLGS